MGSVEMKSVEALSDKKNIAFSAHPSANVERRCFFDPKDRYIHPKTSMSPLLFDDRDGIEKR